MKNFSHKQVPLGSKKKKAGTVALLLALLFALTSCTQSNEPPLKQISSLENLTELDSIVSARAIKLGEYSDYGVTYKIRYKSDDCEVVGYISAPLDYMEKKYPVLIYNRGGNREFGKLNSLSTLGLVEKGYITLASQYRGVDGGTGTEQFGGDDVNDVLKLIDISEQLAFAQKGGVYMVGDSRGGMMTYMACRRDSRIKAAVVASGDSDAVATYNEREQAMKDVLTTLIGGTPQELPEEYEKRSAIKWADEINVPMLIMHGGEADWRVLTHHATDMAEALKKYGKEYKLVIFEDSDHNLQNTGYEDEVANWLQAHPLDGGQEKNP